MAVKSKFFVFAILLCAFAGPAQAYVGPGAGVTLIGAAIGLIVAVVMAVGVIVLWPLRRMLKRRKVAAQDGAGAETVPAPDPD